MSGPKTVFDADECQALLDLIDKKVGFDGHDCVIPTREEDIVHEKLKKAGKFYNSKKKSKKRKVI
jgi:hypothetical protein